MDFFILSKMMQVRTLPGMDSPFHLLHCDKSPCLGSFTRRPFFHSTGISSVVQIRFSRWWSWSTITATPSFRASGGMLSIPFAFPFFKLLGALRISVLVIGPVLICNGSSGSSFGASCGGGRLSTSRKCSFHLASWSSMQVSSLPTLSLTGLLLGLLQRPLRVIFRLYSVVTAQYAGILSTLQPVAHEGGQFRMCL